MRLTPPGASGLVQAMSACLVKTRRARSRHSRDARVYGHTTKAMHKLSTPPPPSPPPRLLQRVIHALHSRRVVSWRVVSCRVVSSRVVSCRAPGHVPCVACNVSVVCRCVGCSGACYDSGSTFSFFF